MHLVVASSNPAKVAEIAAILGAVGVTVTPRPSSLGEVVEDGETLEANARRKAVAVALAAGAPAVADDTGLEVDALGGAPGVRSARYSAEGTDDANVLRLLAALDGVAAAERTARFRTVAMVRWPDGREVAAEGVVEGAIATEARGTAGFGYDPVFVPTEGDGRTFAEMGKAKHEISHRTRALHTLAEALRDA